MEQMLFTIKQVSKLLQLSERHIFNLMKADKLKAIRIGGSTRITVDELKRFVAEAC